tara:strand:- start:127 stop:1230 length:1104 start_codon:yes stop_codon:yes gene_type:complete
MKKKYFENLDGLRFVAFLGVFLYHHNYLFADFFKNHRLTSVLFDQGETAVSFFFVLSGFLISYILMIEKQNRTQINLINFFKKRILRILPLYFLIVLVGFVFIPMMTQGLTHSSFHVNESIQFYLLFGANFDQINLLSALIENSRSLSILWSIAVEEQFYLIWPFLLFLVPLKRLLILFIVIIAGSLAFKVLHRTDDLILHFHTFSVISDLVIGSAIAWLYIYSKPFFKFFENLNKYAIALAYIAGVILIFANEYFPIIERYRILLPLFWAFVILEQCISKNSLFKVSRSKLLSKLGTISYGCYMYHGIVMTSSNLILFKQTTFYLPGSDLLKTGVIGLNLAATTGISYLSYKYFESFFLNLKQKKV